MTNTKQFIISRNRLPVGSLSGPYKLRKWPNSPRSTFERLNW